ncbi:tyrosinase family oxidase copper chaperone [Streptomyces sp. NPDC005574]|uniref:tyrosinase family oxidase copper chaperone n=1 Tax=Streptomyces sp. NPDC005574 TaxID=3156891 RepID=UPI0033BB9558
MSVSVSVGGGVAVPADTGRRDGDRGRAGPPHATRRDALRGLLAPAAAVALAASRAPRTLRAPADLAFDETFLGRRIQGLRTGADGAGGRWHVTVDGRPLHLMRRADGTWLSMVDHYRSYPTALEATRAAVGELVPGQRLRATGGTAADDMSGGGHQHTGGHHGVHP